MQTRTKNNEKRMQTQKTIKTATSTSAGNEIINIIIKKNMLTDHCGTCCVTGRYGKLNAELDTGANVDGVPAGDVTLSITPLDVARGGLSAAILATVAANNANVVAGSGSTLVFNWLSVASVDDEEGTNGAETCAWGNRVETLVVR